MIFKCGHFLLPGLDSVRLLLVWLGWKHNLTRAQTGTGRPCWGERGSLERSPPGLGGAVVLRRHVVGLACPALCWVHLHFFHLPAAGPTPHGRFSPAPGCLEVGPLPGCLCVPHPSGASVSLLTPCRAVEGHRCKRGDSAVSGWECGLWGGILAPPLPGCETLGKLFNSSVP